MTLLLAVSPGGAQQLTAAPEAEAALAARQGRWAEALAALATVQKADPQRYLDGRFDFLAARALAATGHAEEALPRFERFIGPGELLDIPARLAAASLRFPRGDGLTAVELLLPLFARREGAVARRAVRIALDALETKLDPVALARIVAARPALAPRERRRLTALRAEALEQSGDIAGAEKLRLELLEEARRDDAAAVVLARELRGRSPVDLPDRQLGLLIETARSQRDLELAERLAVERDRRAYIRPDPVERWAARFDLSRIRASRGKFQEAADGFESILASRPKLAKVAPVVLRKKKEKKKVDAVGSPAFFARVRFNLGAVYEKLGELDASVAELTRVEKERVGPSGLAVLQRARLEMRRGELDRAEKLLARPTLAKEAGRTEGLLLLVARRAQAEDAAGAARALALVAPARQKTRVQEPWRGELPFWRGLVAETAGRQADALQQYAEVLAAHPYTAAGELARERVSHLDAALVASYSRVLRLAGEALLTGGEASAAAAKLQRAELLGDAPARDLLRLAYQKLPGYADVLLAPELPEERLPVLCGDAAACRLLQLGLTVEAEPIVRDARRLDSILGCLLAARLAEQADAGPAALEAAEALARKIPEGFLLDLAPASVLRALAPRPFDRQVAEAAAESGVPHELLYAVMRQESRFDREAASPAAARGLMQLTLPAASEAARELNEQAPAYADLYDPARSLRLGARTLRSLLDRFAYDPAPVIAAYNAGAGQTALWCGNAKVPAEALLGAISYPETRAYFRRVWANRVLYRLAAAAGGGRRAPASSPAAPASSAPPPR